MSNLLTAESRALAERVDAALRGFASEFRSTLDPGAHVLLDEVMRVIDSGGKRLRPRFCYWGYRAAGGDDCDEILRAAASFELLHTFAIIHDDLVDSSPTRRGRPSSHEALKQSAPGASGNPARFGRAAALLAGDLALVAADRALHSSGFSPAAVARAGVFFDRMRFDAIAGEYRDLVSAHRRQATQPEARLTARLKSGGYTVSDPLKVGAALASAPDEVVDSLAAFGGPLGEAFQIRDDILGIFGDPEATGKDIDGDLREGKQTLLVAATRAEAGADDLSRFDELLGNPELSSSEAEELRQIMSRSGALNLAEETIDALVAEALRPLDSELLSLDARRALRSMASDVAWRSS